VKTTDAIGIFDSGLGGLSVYKEIKALLPNENIIYFGDTKRAPYGSKDKTTLKQYAIEIINFLLSHDVKTIVIGCNTINANLKDDLVNIFDIPFIEIIEPGIVEALNRTQNGRIGVIATRGTINSGIFEKKLTLVNPDIKVYSKACPLLAPMVEEGFVEKNISYLVVDMYLNDIKYKDIDTLILGCTHYPMLEDSIRASMQSVSIVNPAYNTALALKEFLAKNDILNNSEVNFHKFYASGDTDNFDKLCYKFIGEKINSIQV